MTSSHDARIDWRVDAAEWDAFIDDIHERHDTVNGRLIRHHLESAMAEYADEDGYDDVEDLVDRLVRAAGRRPCDLAQEKKSRGIPRSGETTRVARHVDPRIRREFTATVDEVPGESYGHCLGDAIRTYRTGGRAQRLEDKLDRVVDDAEALLSELADDVDDDGSLPKTEKQTIAICNKIGGGEFTRSDLHGAIEDVTGRDTEYIHDRYSERVLDRLGCVAHPNNPELYVPREEAERLAEELGLPGPDAPAIDRKPYSKLSREEKVDGLRITLARNAVKGQDSLPLDGIHSEIFGGHGRRRHIKSVAEEAAEAEGFEFRKVRVSGRQILQVDVHAVRDSDVRDAINRARSESGTDDEPAAASDMA